MVISLQMLDHRVAWDLPCVAKGWFSLAWLPKFRNLCEENFRQLGKTSLCEVVTSPRAQMLSVQGGSQPAVGFCLNNCDKETNKEETGRI